MCRRRRHSHRRHHRWTTNGTTAAAALSSQKASWPSHRDECRRKVQAVKVQEAASAYPPVESSSSVAGATNATSAITGGASSSLSDAESLLARGLEHLDIARRGAEKLGLGDGDPLPDELRVEAKVALALFAAADAEDEADRSPASIAADVTYRLGEAHRILQNDVVALSFLVKASRLKSAAALNALGLVFKDGALGQEVDLRRAFEAFTESVDVSPQPDAQW